MVNDQEQSPTYKAVLRRFEPSTDSVRWYLSPLEDLIKRCPWEASIAWVFLRIEQVQHRALYCGIVKLHRVDKDLAEVALEGWQITREGFDKLFEVVFGVKLPASVRDKIKRAEGVRDKVIHGKKTTAADIRDSLVDAIAFAERLNAELKRLAGVEPCASIKGFKGRGQTHDKKTSRWILKGMGFAF